ncbi:MAG TPA: hypothetical protein V6D11_23360 [Waterburya sp.]|jgi:hypothetical protein
MNPVLSVLYLLFVFPVIVAFILGFLLYGVNKPVTPPKTGSETPSSKISAKLFNQLEQEGYIESGKLKTEDLTKALTAYGEPPSAAG